MHRHIELLMQRRPDLETCAPKIEKAFALMRTMYLRDSTLLLAGNGGSAADADHWTDELLKGFHQKRRLAAELTQGLGPELASRLQGSLRHPAVRLFRTQYSLRKRRGPDTYLR